MFGIPVWAGWLALGLLMMGGSFYEGWHERSLRADADLAKAEQLINLQTVQADKITEDAIAVSETHALAITNFTNALILEVTKYVSPSDDAACTLHVGFVRLLNDAASGQQTVSDTAGQLDASPSGVELHTIAASIAGNYGTCRAIRAQLVDLQGWVAAEQKVK